MRSMIARMIFTYLTGNCIDCSLCNFPLVLFLQDLAVIWTEPIHSAYCLWGGCRHCRWRFQYGAGRSGVQVWSWAFFENFSFCHFRYLFLLGRLLDWFSHKLVFWTRGESLILYRLPITLLQIPHSVHVVASRMAGRAIVRTTAIRCTSTRRMWVDTCFKGCSPVDYGLQDESKRIDYILYKSGRMSISLDACDVALNKVWCLEGA